MSAPLVAIRGLTVAYGEVRALDGLDLEIGKGAVALLGPNGAGKTTLIRVLLGLLAPPEGKVGILGLDPRDRKARFEIRRRVGYMPENECVMPGMNGFEIVALLGRLSGLSRSDAMTRAHEVLDYAGIEEERYREATDYPAGLRQRLKLAQALVHDPGFLLLDEPTNGLDPRARAAMLDLIDDLASRHGKDMLVCTHLLPDVERLCGEVIVLNRGRVVRQAGIGDLTRAREEWLRVRTAGDPGPLAAALRELGHTVESEAGGSFRVRPPASADADFAFLAAAACGATIVAVESVRPSLEAAFLDLVATPAREER